MIADRLRGLTTRSVISVVDSYAKASARMRLLGKQGVELVAQPEAHPNFERLMRGMAQIAQNHELEIQSCAETLDLAQFGILPGKCIDDLYLEKLFGKEVIHRKDKNQRDACGCVQSRDIGMYDTCLFGCSYCYATTSFATARRNHEAHDPNSPSLIGYYDAPASASGDLELKQPRLF
jgi:hypothetical protein